MGQGEVCNAAVGSDTVDCTMWYFQMWNYTMSHTKCDTIQCVGWCVTRWVLFGVLCDAVRCDNLWFRTVWHGVMQCCAVWQGTMWHGVLQCCVTLYDVTTCDAVLCDTVRWRITQIPIPTTHPTPTATFSGSCKTKFTVFGRAFKMGSVSRCGQPGEGHTVSPTDQNCQAEGFTSQRGSENGVAMVRGQLMSPTAILMVRWWTGWHWESTWSHL